MMSIFKNLRMEWKTKTSKQKFQTVVHVIFDVGIDLLAGYAVQKLVPEDEPKWKKAAAVMGAGGISIWAADAASKSTDELLNAVWPDKEEKEHE